MQPEESWMKLPLLVYLLGKKQVKNSSIGKAYTHRFTNGCTDRGCYDIQSSSDYAPGTTESCHKRENVNRSSLTGFFMTLTYRVDDTERHKTQVISYPEKTADIWRRYHWFSRQMTSEKRAQKFDTDDASLPVVLLIGRAAWEI